MSTGGGQILHIRNEIPDTVQYVAYLEVSKTFFFFFIITCINQNLNSTKGISWKAEKNDKDPEKYLGIIAWGLGLDEIHPPSFSNTTHSLLISQQLNSFLLGGLKFKGGISNPSHSSMGPLRSPTNLIGQTLSTAKPPSYSASFDSISTTSSNSNDNRSVANRDPPRPAPLRGGFGSGFLRLEAGMDL